MKIGVISDTHIPNAANQLPPEVFALFEDVELIVHAGDLTELAVIAELESIAETVAVRGNMDDSRVAEALPDKRIIDVEGFKIGLIHGRGAPRHLGERMLKEFDEKIDALVFGHSHKSENRMHDGVLLFNPGSPTDKIFTRTNSLGILTVERDKGIKADIISITI